MSLIERSEKRITDLIDAAPHPDGDFYADVLEVLQGRREQVETLRQQLAGAVDAFERYARHDDGCAGDAICTCCLTVIRAAISVGGTVNIGGR